MRLTTATTEAFPFELSFLLRYFVEDSSLKTENGLGSFEIGGRVLNSVTGDQTEWLSRSWPSVAPIHSCQNGGRGGKRPRSELRYLGCKVEGVTTLPGLGVQDSRQARGQGGEESVE